MSPRPTRLRRVSDPPSISGMKPYGENINPEGNEKVFLHFEEYEAIRLCDYQGLNHHEASSRMGVSRPTFTRIYSRARNKLAQAIVLGNQLILEGGKVYFDTDWFRCNNCSCFFNHPEKHEKIGKCPLCGSTAIDPYESYPGESGTKGQNK